MTARIDYRRLLFSLLFAAFIWQAPGYADTKPLLSSTIRGEAQPNALGVGYFPVQYANWGTFKTYRFTGTVALNSQIELRYMFGVLLGEPLSQYNVRYDLTDAVLEIPDLPLTLRQNPAIDKARQTGPHVEVPPGYFDAVQMRTLRFKITRTDWQQSGMSEPAIYTAYTGVFGNSGQWGWDVTGSPSWDGMMHRWNENEPNERNALPAEYVKEAWRQMLRDPERPDWQKGRARWEPVEVEFYVSGLLALIERDLPGVFDKPEAEGYGPADTQLASLIIMHKAWRMERTGADGIYQPDEKTRRLYEMIERYRSSFSGALDKELARMWDEEVVLTRSAELQSELPPLKEAAERTLSLSGYSEQDKAMREAKTLERKLSQIDPKGISPQSAAVRQLIKVLGIGTPVYVVATKRYDVAEVWSYDWDVPQITLQTITIEPKTAEERREMEEWRRQRAREAEEEKRKEAERKARAKRQAAERKAKTKRTLAAIPKPVKTGAVGLSYAGRISPTAMDTEIQGAVRRDSLDAGFVSMVEHKVISALNQRSSLPTGFKPEGDIESVTEVVGWQVFLTRDAAESYARSIEGETIEIDMSQ